MRTSPLRPTHAASDALSCPPSRTGCGRPGEAEDEGRGCGEDRRGVPTTAPVPGGMWDWVELENLLSCPPPSTVQHGWTGAAFYKSLVLPCYTPRSSQYQARRILSCLAGNDHQWRVHAAIQDWSFPGWSSSAASRHQVPQSERGICAGVNMFPCKEGFEHPLLRWLSPCSGLS